MQTHSQQCEILITNHLQRNGFCHAALFSFFLPSSSRGDSWRTRHHRTNSLSLRMSHTRERSHLVYFSNCWWRNFLLLKGILYTDPFLREHFLPQRFYSNRSVSRVHCKITTTHAYTHIHTQTQKTTHENKMHEHKPNTLTKQAIYNKKKNKSM